MSRNAATCQASAAAWVLGHVRAGQEVAEQGIAAAGFEKAEEVTDLLARNDLVVFTRGKAAPPNGPGRPGRSTPASVSGTST